MKKFIIVLSSAALLLCSCGPQARILSNCSYDKAVFAEQYRRNKAEWDAVFDCIARNRFDTMTLKKPHYITAKTFVRVSEITTKPGKNWEAHRKVIDFFYCLGGSEKVGVAPIGSMRDVQRPYTEKKDVETYASTPDARYVTLSKGKGIILFPSDAHMPNLPDGEPGFLRVATFKVPYAAK